MNDSSLRQQLLGIRGIHKWLIINAGIAEDFHAKHLKEPPSLKHKFFKKCICAAW